MPRSRVRLKHCNPNVAVASWKSAWTLSEDGNSAVHQNGLIVHFVESQAVPTPESSAMVRDAMVADLGSDWHWGAELYELLSQAERLFKERQLH